MPDLTASVLAGLLLASVVGGAIQGVIGFGFALVAVPVLALVQPDAVPVTVMLMAIPMTVFMALRERAHIDGRGFTTIMVGRVLGQERARVAGLHDDLPNASEREKQTGDDGFHGTIGFAALTGTGPLGNNVG